MLFVQLFLFFIASNGLFIPQSILPVPSDGKLLSANSNSSLINPQKGFVTFLQPFIVIKESFISMVTPVTIQNTATNVLQHLALVRQLNASGANRDSKQVYLSYANGTLFKSFDLDAGALKFNGIDPKKLMAENYATLLSDNASGEIPRKVVCDYSRRHAEFTLCYEKSEGFTKREEPQVSAQLLHQVFLKVKQGTEKVSDNIDFLAESPKEFFLNLDEKIDDKMMNIADKWEEAKNMPAVIEPDIYRETSEVLVDEVEDSDVSVDYDGYQD